MEENSYNGWKNYETWLVKLWLDNDREIVDYIYDSIEDMDVYEASKWIEDFVEDLKPDISGLFDDMIYASLGRVAWYDIAEAFKDEI